MKEVRKNRMGTEPILKLITKMSIPAMFSMLVQALYNIVDSIFVAQISDEALTAISLAFPVQVLLIAVAVGTGVGVNSLISRRLGERRQDDADNAAKHGIILGFISWVPFLIFGLLFTKIFFESFTSNQSPGRGAFPLRRGINPSVSFADSIPTPFVPSGHFPLIGGIGPWEGRPWVRQPFRVCLAWARAWQRAETSASVLSRENETRMEPSMTAGGRPMASSTWLRCPFEQAEPAET